MEAAGAVLGMIGLLNSMIELTDNIYDARKAASKWKKLDNLEEDVNQVVLLRAILIDTGKQFLVADSPTSSIQDVLHDCERRLVELSLLFELDLRDRGESLRDKNIKELGLTPTFRMRKLPSKRDTKERREALKSFRESVVLLHQLSSA